MRALFSDLDRIPAEAAAGKVVKEAIESIGECLPRCVHEEGVYFIMVTNLFADSLISHRSFDRLVRTAFSHDTARTNINNAHCMVDAMRRVLSTPNIYRRIQRTNDLPSGENPHHTADSEGILPS